MKTLKLIKNSFIFNKSTSLLAIAIIFGCFIIGEAVSAILVHTLINDGTYASMGVLLSTMSLAFLTFLFSQDFITNFEMQIKMGKKRISALIANMFVMYVSIAVSLLTCFVLNIIDKLVVNNFTTLTYEIDFSFYIYQPELFLQLIVVVVLAAAITFALKKWGVIVFWVCWAIFMLSTFTAPRLAEKMFEPDGSLVSKFLVALKDFVTGINSALFMVLGGIVALILLIFPVVSALRYEIKK